MIIVFWSGYGLLVGVIVVGFALACNFAFDALLGAGYYEAHKWTIGVAMLLSAVVCWRLGMFLRNRNAQIVIDKATGKEMALDRSNHSLFFIPMHLWGPILAVIGVVLSIMDFVK